MIKKQLFLTINFVLFIFIFSFFSFFIRKLSFDLSSLMINLFGAIIFLIPFIFSIKLGTTDIDNQPKKILYKMPITTIIAGIILTVIIFLYYFAMELISGRSLGFAGGFIFIVPILGVIISLFFSIISFIIALIIYFFTKNSNKSL